MATCKIWGRSNDIGQLIDYDENPDKTTLDRNTDYLNALVNYTTDGFKTSKGQLVSGINCSPKNAKQEMMTALQINPRNRKLVNVAYHGIQSFLPGEVTPEQCHQIGVELAEKLWGDKYMVLVSTHLDKDHLHNHFCICAVSPFDGKRFNNNGKTKYEMREESDKLCRKHSLSVITNPKGYKYKNYGEWRATKMKGEATHRSMLYRDIDSVIEHSISEQEFYNNMRKLGYRIIIRGDSVSVGYAYWDRNIRLNKDKNGYSLAEIRQRIYTGVKTKPVFRPYRSKQLYYKGSLYFTRSVHSKRSGFIALYYRYCYALGVFSHHKHQTYYTPPGLRSEINKMNVLFDELSLLNRNHITTADELTYFRSELINKKMTLSEKRQVLRNEKAKTNDFTEQQRLKSEISQYTSQIRKTTRQIKLCDDIEANSQQRAKALNEELHRQQREAEKDKPVRSADDLNSINLYDTTLRRNE